MQPLLQKSFLRSFRRTVSVQVLKKESAWGSIVDDHPFPVNIRIGRLEEMVEERSELEKLLERHQQDKFIISLIRSQKQKLPRKSNALLIAFR